MTHAVYVAAGWVVSFAAVGGYTLWVLVRGRALSRRVPPEDRRWM
ncbi:hypothetical protein BH18ACT4_BH18ACT4_06500 [soil metagenome]